MGGSVSLLSPLDCEEGDAAAAVVDVMVTKRSASKTSTHRRTSEGGIQKCRTRDSTHSTTCIRSRAFLARFKGSTLQHGAN